MYLLNAAGEIPLPVATKCISSPYSGTRFKCSHKPLLQK